MERRVLATLGLLALVVLTGCSAAGSLSMEAADDAEIAEAASRPAVVESHGPDDQAVVREAIENGSGTATATEPPVDRGLPFVYSDTYYEVNWNVTGTELGTAFVVGVDLNGTASVDETVAFEELSEHDRQLLGSSISATTADEDRLRPGPEISVFEEYTMAETNSSVLLSSEYSAVRYNGTIYPFEINERENVALSRYRYTVSTVADSTAAYAQQIREKHLITLSGLSEDEKVVVNEAIDGVYYAEDTDDEAFRSVMDYFPAESAIDAESFGGTWLVRYDGEVYVADLSYGGFDLNHRPVTEE